MNNLSPFDAALISTVGAITGKAVSGSDKNDYRGTKWRDVARPDQLAPAGDWRVWLLLAGRGFGKTRVITEWAAEQAEKYPQSRGFAVAATAADVRDVLVEGESGFLAKARPDFTPVYEPSKRRLTWPNGSQAMLLSADEPDRFRGPQFHWGIGDELAAWRYPSTFDMLMFGLRLGDDPRAAFATTPRPTKLIKDLIKSSTTHVTRGSTYDNRANLAPAYFDEIITKYEGTRLGRQELNAEILDDAPGALWSREQIEADRVSDMPPMKRIVIAIDPAPTSSEGSNQTGIVGFGVGMNGHGYVLDAKALRVLPNVWAKESIAMYHKNSADRIVGEANNGGDMIETVIKAIDGSVAYKKVHASRGKTTRAEPVAALYEQHRVHHVGMFPELEDQLCGWEQGMESPDLLDALVWAATETMIDTRGEAFIDDAPDWLYGRGL